MGLKDRATELKCPAKGMNLPRQLDLAARQVYDISQDHHKLQKASEYQGMDRGSYFDSLRKNYAVRREFENYRVSVERGYSAEAVETLKELGFSS